MNAKTYELLKPHVRPRLPALALVFVLAAMVSFGQKAPILLLGPLWNRVLFPPEAASDVARAAPDSQIAALSWVDQRFTRLEAWLTSSLVGDDAVAVGSDEAKRNALLTVAFALVAFAIFSALAQFGFTMVSRWVALRMIVDLRMRLAEHLMGLSLRYHSERRFGDLLSRISNDVTITLRMIEVFMKDVIKQPLLIAGSIGAAAVIAPRPTLYAVLGLPILAIPISVLGKRVRRKSKQSLRALGASVEALTQMFRGIRTVKSFRAEKREVERYRSMNDSYLRSAMRMVRAAAWIQGTTAFLSYVGFAVLVVLVGWVEIARRGFDEGGNAMMFFLAISMVFEHVRRTTGSWNKIQESRGASERLLLILDEPVDIENRPDARPIHAIEREIRFENVSFRYAGAEEFAIRDLELTIRRGETLALVGPSGAGKTTTIDLLARFLDPTEGRITVDGADLRDLSLDGWTALYALVGQNPFLFHDTIEGNIRYGRPDATRDEIVAAARAAHIHDFIESLPQGYATVVGDDGSRLSGGQRQRLTIARAILKQAPLLLLDEATSSLDSEAEAEVQAALDLLMRDRTVIVIAHRLSTVRRADRICVLEAGRKVDIGTHDELLARGGTYQKLHEIQFGEQALLERQTPATGSGPRS